MSNMSPERRLGICPASDTGRPLMYSPPLESAKISVEARFPDTPLFFLFRKHTKEEARCDTTEGCGNVCLLQQHQLAASFQAETALEQRGHTAG
mmetsp:Transcript_4781/g.9112  ORF Transcript_4781/g.9112 Transcript_4781/m.9112 type:complete len:94 (-) Transcript_4781:3029-3310(-)